MIRRTVRVPLPDRPVTAQPAIPTPVFIRWRRFQHRLIPFLAVLLAAGSAWRLWHEAPRITAVGQVDLETYNVRSPATGEAIDPPPGQPPAPRRIETVAPGQVLARVRKPDGATQEVTTSVGGQVVKVQFRPGEPVTAGQTLFTIAGDRGTSITTYVRSNQRARPEPGMTVDIRQQSDASRTFHAVVERVGPQYEPVPAAQLRDRKAEEWGLPVVISIPQNVNLKPGELVYIGWLPNPSPGD